MSIKLFVTGTDTDIGKTYVAAGLLRAFNKLGYSTIGIKPIASGCFQVCDRLYSSDALALLHASSVKLRYDLVNPLAFLPAVTPHIAAQYHNIILSKKMIQTKIQSIFPHAADVYIIEGVGGWAVPLNDTETMADVVASIDCAVILVVGMRLGCLNHAILTAQAIRQKSIPLLGWIANCIDPNMQELDLNIQTLQQWLPCPNLGVIPFGEVAEEKLNINSILNFYETNIYNVLG